MSKKLEALLEAAQAAEQPSAGTVDASWAQIDRRIHAGAGPSVPVDVRGLPGFSKAALPLLAKIALVAAVAGSVAVGVMQVGSPEPARPLRTSGVGEIAAPSHPKPAAVAADPPPAATPPPAVLPVTPEAEPIATPAKSSRRPKAKPAPVPSRLAEETALLRKAWRALEQGRSVQAATVIAKHESEFPRGSLVEEREAVRAVLGCRRDASSAESTAARFAKRYPKSIHRARVRRACTEDKK
jgi:hypothetical protein